MEHFQKLLYDIEEGERSTVIYAGNYMNMPAVAHALGTCPRKHRLQELRLEFCRLSPCDINTLTESLRGTALMNLFLDNVGLDLISLEWLLRGLQDTTVSFLSFQQNPCLMDPPAVLKLFQKHLPKTSLVSVSSGFESLRPCLYRVYKRNREKVASYPAVTARLQWEGEFLAVIDQETEAVELSNQRIHALDPPDELHRRLLLRRQVQKKKTGTLTLLLPNGEEVRTKDFLDPLPLTILTRSCPPARLSIQLTPLWNVVYQLLKRRSMVFAEAEALRAKAMAMLQDAQPVPGLNSKHYETGDSLLHMLVSLESLDLDLVAALGSRKDFLLKNEPNLKGQTPLQLACSLGRPWVREVLPMCLGVVEILTAKDNRTDILLRSLGGDEILRMSLTWEHRPEELLVAFESQRPGELVKVILSTGAILNTELGLMKQVLPVWRCLEKLSIESDAMKRLPLLMELRQILDSTKHPAGLAFVDENGRSILDHFKRLDQLGVPDLKSKILKALTGDEKALLLAELRRQVALFVKKNEYHCSQGSITLKELLRRLCMVSALERLQKLTRQEMKEQGAHLDNLLQQATLLGTFLCEERLTSLVI